MKTKISVASLKPYQRTVSQLTTLFGTWSRKMNHSASPRNRSSRMSRPDAMTGFTAMARSLVSQTAARCHGGASLGAQRPRRSGPARTLTDDLLVPQRGDVLAAQPGDSLQHLIGVLAERRRRAAVVDRRVGEAVVRADDRHLARLAVLVDLE